jgi:hypothetical protein
MQQMLLLSLLLQFMLTIDITMAVENCDRFSEQNHNNNNDNPHHAVPVLSAEGNVKISYRCYAIDLLFQHNSQKNVIYVINYLFCIL